jgi:hypothetical protein
VTGPMKVGAAPVRTAERAPVAVRGWASVPVLQRKCACGGVPGVDGECAECKKKRLLQRSARSSPSGAAVPSVVHDVLREPGVPLESATREDMQQRFGRDFSGVRVHTDPRAAESARAVDAHAYTVGQHIVFDHGRYQPHSASGRHLLSHELAHTVQQHGLQRTGGPIEAAETPRYRALEREADRAAFAAMAAPPISTAAAPPAFAPSLSRAPAPMLSRVPAPAPAPGPPTGTTKVSYTTDYGTYQVWLETTAGAGKPGGANVPGGFFVDKFYLPKEKGPVGKIWQDAADAGALVATIDTSSNEASAEAWQKRDKTPELKASWLQALNWPSDQADALWSAAGGDSTFPRKDSKACQLDHIVELQIGGTNVPNNLQALDAFENQSSGGQIKAQVFGLALLIAKQFTPRLDSVRLVFKKVVPSAALECPACKGKNKAVTCVDVNCCARDAAIARPGTATNETGKFADYTLAAGAVSAIVEAQPTPTGTTEVRDLLWESVVPRNKTAAQLIPGLILLELIQRPKNKGDSVRAGLDPRAGVKGGTRVPDLLQFTDAHEKGGGLILPATGKGRSATLKLPSKHPAKIHYRYLSDGSLTLDFDPSGGIYGKGIITGSIPLLNRLKVPIELKDGTLNLVGDLPLKGWSPFPQTKVTRADVRLGLVPEFKPEGTIEMILGAESKPLATAVLTLSADTNGLVAVAKVDVHLPSVDKAGGTVEYRNGEWSGSIVVSSTQIKIPGVKKGELVVTFTNAGPAVSGAVDLLIAEKYPATLAVTRNAQGRWLFTGSTVITLPILQPVSISIAYDGDHFTGEGRTGFTYKGLGGHLHVIYRDGHITGDGTLDVHKGKANGTITVKLSERQQISGHGDIEYQFSENLVGKLGIDVPEVGPVRVIGGITVPKPIALFRHFGGEKRFFDYHVDIPILGVSVGPISIGLIARISAGLGAHYGIGPGTLEGVHIVTAFNPLEPDPDIDLEAGAKLVVPAEAGVDLSVRGALGVSAGIASVTGGITVTGSAGLHGALGADVTIRYHRGDFHVKAEAGLSVKPVLGLSLDADVTAEAGAFGFTIERKKVWHLTGWSFPLDAELGMSAPIEYDSKTGLKVPSVNDIKWTTPTVDVDKVGKGAMAQARGTDTAGKS